MVKRIALLLCILLCCEGLHAQKKLVFRKGWKRVVIKPGKDIGITEKGEEFRYQNWKNICSGCYFEPCMDSLYARPRYHDSTFFYYRDCRDTGCINNIWTLDSIIGNEIVLRRLPLDSAKYRRDTIPVVSFDQYERDSLRDYDGPVWFEVDSVTGEVAIIDSGYVIMTITGYDRKRVALDSLASITFPCARRCSSFGIGVPVIALTFAVACPIAAADKSQFNGKYGWAFMIFGEAMAGWLTYSMIRSVKDQKVRTYELDEWEVRPRRFF